MENLNKKVLIFGCLPVFLVVLLLIFSALCDEPKPKTRTETIESQFSEWDGSHKRLEKYVKSQMNDPESYAHIKTIYWDKDSFLIVKTTYRGSNVFGGIVLGTTKAKINLDGSIIEIQD